MGLFEQVHAQVVVVGDYFVAEALAQVCRHFGEEVEGAVGAVDFQPGDFTGETHHQVAAALEGQTHIFHTLLRTLICSEGCALGYG